MDICSATCFKTQHGCDSTRGQDNQRGEAVKQGCLPATLQLEAPSTHAQQVFTTCFCQCATVAACFAPLMKAVTLL
jgi:hypothetical protein